MGRTGATETGRLRETLLSITSYLDRLRYYTAPPGAKLDLEKFTRNLSEDIDKLDLNRQFVKHEYFGRLLDIIADLDRFPGRARDDLKKLRIECAYSNLGHTAEGGQAQADVKSSNDLVQKYLVGWDTSRGDENWKCIRCGKAPAYHEYYLVHDVRVAIPCGSNKV